MEIGYETANQIHQDLNGVDWDRTAWERDAKGKTFAETYSMIANSQGRRDYQNLIATWQKQANAGDYEPINEQLYRKKT